MCARRPRLAPAPGTRQRTRHLARQTLGRRGRPPPSMVLASPPPATAALRRTTPPLGLLGRSTCSSSSSTRTSTTRGRRRRCHLLWPRLTPTRGLGTRRRPPLAPLPRHGSECAPVVRGATTRRTGTPVGAVASAPAARVRPPGLARKGGSVLAGHTTRQCVPTRGTRARGHNMRHTAGHGPARRAKTAAARAGRPSTTVRGRRSRHIRSRMATRVGPALSNAAATPTPRRVPTATLWCGQGTPPRAASVAAARGTPALVLACLTTG